MLSVLWVSCVRWQWTMVHEPCACVFLIDWNTLNSDHYSHTSPTAIVFLSPCPPPSVACSANCWEEFEFLKFGSPPSQHLPSFSLSQMGVGTSTFVIRWINFLTMVCHLFSRVFLFIFTLFFFFAFLFKSGFFVTLLNEPFFFPFSISWPLSTRFLNGIALFHVPGFGNYLRCVLSFNALAQVKFWSRRKYDLSAHFLAISGITLKFSNSSFQNEWVALVMCGVKI